MVYDFSSLSAALDKGGKTLGTAIFWDMEESRIDRSKLEYIWSKWGLDKKFLPEEPNDEKALRVAVLDASVGRKGDESAILSKNDDDEMVYSLQKVALKDGVNGDVQQVQRSKVILFKHAAKLGLDASHPYALAIRDAWDIMRTTHTADEIRRMLVRTMDSYNGFKLRKRGGAYFIPAPNVADALNLRAAVMDISPRNTFHTLNISESKVDIFNQDLAESAEDALADDLTELYEEMKAFEDKAPRIATLEDRLLKFEEMRSKGELFKSVLGAQVDELNSALDRLKAKVEGLIPMAK